MYKLTLALYLLAGSLSAQNLTSLTTYVQAQVPANTTRQVTPQNVQNAILAFPSNVFISTSQPITATSYVRATTYYGDGSNLTGIAAGTTPTWGAIQGIPTQVQAVSNGTPITLTGLTINGPITGTSYVSASTYYGDGSNLTGISGGSATTIGGVSGSIQFNKGSGSALGGGSGLTTDGLGNLTASGIISANTLDSFFISGTSIWGAAGTFPGGLTIGNVTSNVVITGGSMTGTGLVTSAGISSSAGITGTTFSGTTATFTNIAGTITTAAQSNITSVGALTGLTVNGQVTATALGATLISATAPTGTVTATNVYARNISATALTVGSCTGCGGGGSAISASVVFNGSATNSTTAIIKAQNVQYVSRTVAGRYLITFNPVMADTSYTIVCSTAQVPGGNWFGAIVSDTTEVRAGTLGLATLTIAGSAADSSRTSCIFTD